MNPDDLAHDSFVLERRYDAPPARVYAAYADLDARCSWGAPSPEEAIVYSEHDFRSGGRDVHRCGPREDLRYLGSVRYEHLVEDRRIVLVERIESAGALLSVALITWDLEPDGDGTRLRLTTQITSLVGASMIQGSRGGTRAALANLGAWLGRH